MPLPTQQWFELAKSLPLDAPDDLYDAQREKFFEQTVMPVAMEKGWGETQARQVFMQQTARPGKSSFPRAAVAGTTALESFAGPLLKDTQLGSKLERAKGAALKEAEKQNVGTLLPEMAGVAIGELPYWAAGLEAASVGAKLIKAGQVAKGILTAAEAAGKTPVDRIAATAAGAVVQGAYDAARAEDGRALTEGLQGAVVGGGLAAAAELAGPLWRALRGEKGRVRIPGQQAPEVGEVVAKAVEAEAKGVADEAQQVIAQQALQDLPELNNHIKLWVKEQVNAAKKAGVPASPPEIEYHGRVQISVRTKEGKVFSAGGPKGLDPGQLPGAVEKIGKWLDQGAEIQTIKGDPLAVHAFYQQLSKVKHTDVPMKIQANEARIKEIEAQLAKGAAQPPAPKVTLIKDPTPVDPQVQQADSFSKLNKMSEDLKGLGADTETLDFLIERAQVNPEVTEAAEFEARQLMSKLSRRKGAGARVVSDAEKFALEDAPDEVLSQFEPEVESLETGAKKKAPKLRTGEKAPKIEAKDLTVESRYELRYDGKIKDIVDGRVYQDMPSALKAGGFEVRNASKKVIEAHGNGAWFNKDGKEQYLKPDEWHEEGDLDKIWDRIRSGDVRVRKDGVDFAESSPFPAIYKGVQFALGESKDGNIRLLMKPRNEAVILNRDSLEDFFADPAKYMKQNDVFKKMKAGGFEVRSAAKRPLGKPSEAELIAFRNQPKIRTLRKELLNEAVRMADEDLKLSPGDKVAARMKQRAQQELAMIDSLEGGFEMRGMARDPMKDLLEKFTGPLPSAKGPLEGEASRRELLKKMGGATAGMAAKIPEISPEQIQALQTAAKSSSAAFGVLKELLGLSAPIGTIKKSSNDFETFATEITNKAGKKRKGVFDLSVLREVEEDPWMYSEANFNHSSLQKLLVNPKLSKEKGAMMEEAFTDLTSKEKQEMIGFLSDVEEDSKELFETGVKRFARMEKISVDQVKSSVKKEQERVAARSREIDEDYARGYQERLQKEQMEQQKLRSGTVTPGMELQRTHLPVGEEGTEGMMMRFGKKDSLHQLINQRDSLLHFTSLEGASGILKSGKIDPELTDMGKVSTTRVPSVGTKVLPHQMAGGPIAFVLDRSNLRSKPLNNLYKAASDIPSYRKGLHANLKTPDAIEAEEVIDSIVGLQNVKGIIVDKAAASVEEGRWSATNQKLAPILQAAKRRGIPVKFVDFEKELPSYRAELSNQPSHLRFKQSSEGQGLPGATEGTVSRPLGQRTVTSDPSQYPWLGEDWGAAAFVKEGVSPQTYYIRDTLDRGTVWHETTHGLTGYTGMTKPVADLFEDGMGKKLINAFSPEIAKAYKARGMWGEEVFTYLGQAFRTKNEEMIQAFVDADGSRQQLSNWLNSNVDEMMEQLAGKHDSLFKRRLETRLKDLKLRSGSIADFEAEAEKLGYNVYYTPEGWQLWDPREQSLQKFATKDDLAQHMVDNFMDPEMAPEMVDFSFLPEGIPRYSSKSAMKGGSGVPPIQTDPSPVALPKGGRIRSGWLGFSNFFRPREQWMEAVARKHDWPELYDVYREVVAADLASSQFAGGWEVKLTELIKDLKPDRRKALGAWRHAKSTPEAAADLGLSPEEIAVSKKITELVTDPLYAEFKIGDFAKYVEDYIPRLRENGWDPDKIKPTGKLAPEEIKFWAELNRVGNLDPRDNDIGRVLGSYINAGARKKFMEDPLSKLAKMVNAKNEEGTFVAGNLQPMLVRMVENFRGQPDYTYGLINSAMNGMLDGLKVQVAKVNKFLPERLQIEGLDNKEGKDLLSKWMLLQYAGGMGLRPMAYIRDGLQFLMTTYPILGGKHMLEGMRMTLKGAKEGKSGVIYQIPKAYGAIVEHSPLSDLYSTTGSVEGGAVTKFAQATMRPMQWSNNVNRLMSFWGHHSKAMNALESELPLADKVRESGMTWLPQLLKDKFVKELEAGPADLHDFASRMSKELVDLSQWNYTRGASPGVYKYALGRLLGMYGTWPMNYVEYARMLATQGDKSEKIKATTRLVAAHATILGLGDVSGVDTATWVFSSPAAYGGSPIYQSIVNLPGTLDFETYRGDQARRQVVSPIWPLSVPGGITLQNLIEAVATDDPDGWAKVMGFKPMKEGETEKGLHALIPD